MLIILIYYNNTLYYLILIEHSFITYCIKPLLRIHVKSKRYFKSAERNQSFVRRILCNCHIESHIYTKIVSLMISRETLTAYSKPL